MAEGLATLVRVNEWAVDNKRRELGVLLRELNELVDKLSYLEHEVVVEQDTATNDPEEAGFLYGVYAEGVIQRRQNFDAAIRDKEAEINVARESLNEAYRTLKKFEVIRDNRDAREQKERDHIDQTELNDVGLETHWRYNSKQ